MNDDNEREIGRRKFVKTAGAVATLGVTAESASASHTDDVVAAHKPSYVTMHSYSEQTALIEKYQPKLRTSHLNVQPEAVYAAYFESSEQDTDCIAYWVWYPTQQGVSTYDSHYSDREPILVFVNSDGSVNRIHYSGWHYLVARYPDPPVSADSGEHPLLSVVKPHHHHIVRPDEPDVGSYPSLDDFTDIVQPWYDNGWAADADVVLNPWMTDYRESWWSEGEFGVNWLENRAKLSLRLARISPLDTATTDL